MRRKIAAYAQLMRLSNAPTVVTNVLVGMALAADVFPTERVAAVMATAFAIYFAGMILNDLFDAPHDAEHKPDRPIPSGNVSAREAVTLASILLAMAAFASLSINLVAFGLSAALVFCVVLYDLLHKRSAWLCAVMGACRSLVYALGVVSMGGSLSDGRLLGAMLSIVVYIALLTFVARREDDGSVGWRAKLSVLMPLTAVAPIVLIANEYFVSGWAIATYGMFLVWMLRSCWLLLRRTPDVRGAVMGWLSGICLFDAALLATNGNDTLSFVALGCFVVTALSHRFVSGT